MKVNYDTKTDTLSVILKDGSLSPNEYASLRPQTVTLEHGRGRRHIGSQT